MNQTDLTVPAMADAVDIAAGGSIWILYVLKCSDNSLYTGITNNLNNRVARHNTGKGAKYTRSRRPVSVVASQPAGTRSQALKLEYRFKQLTRSQKLQHVESQLLDFLDSAK